MTIVAILALAVVALAGSAYAYLVYSPKPQMPTLNSVVQHATMRVGDRERSYLAYVPERLPSGAALVIVLHSSGMDGAKMRAWTGYEFDHMADQQGFVVLHRACRPRTLRPAPNWVKHPAPCWLMGPTIRSTLTRVAS
jgi:polyhydroxybutyrate depolymerase